MKMRCVGWWMAARIVSAVCAGSLTVVGAPTVDSVGDLVEHVNGAWTNDCVARAVPPASVVYNRDLGVAGYAAGFDTNFLAGLTVVTNGTVATRPLLVLETNTTPRARVFCGANGTPVYTASVDITGYPESWTEEVYGAHPPWLSGNELDTWYALRDPARQRVHVMLVATSDVPAYIAAMTNAVGASGSGTNAIPLLDLYSNDIAFVGIAVSSQAASVYVHAPEDVARIDLFDSTNLTTIAGGWWLAATLDHEDDPILWSGTPAASNAFYCAGDADTDTDGDGLSDIRELRLYGTNPTQRDSDDDGLSDGEEVLTYDLDPIDTDSDDDGLTDGWEVFVASYPTDPDAGTPVGVAGVFGDYETGGAKSERYVLHALPLGATNLSSSYQSWTNAATNTATAFTNAIPLGTARTLNLRWYSHAPDGRPIVYDHDYQWYIEDIATNALQWSWLPRCAVDQTRTNALVYSPYTNGTLATGFAAASHLGNHYTNRPTQDLDFANPLSAAPVTNGPPGKRIDVYVPLVDLDPANASNVVADVWIGEGVAPGTIIAVGTGGLRRVRFTRGPETMPTGTVTLAIASGANRIRVWRDPAMATADLLLSAGNPSTNWILAGASTWSAIPTNVWVEGVTNSAAPGDTAIAATFSGPSGTLCADTNLFTTLKIQLFRDEACTMVLDDWPEDGDQLRSPKYVFPRDSNIFVRVLGPGGLGDTRITVRAESESSATSVHLHLHEVGSGVYVNRDAAGSEVLRLDESTYVGSGNDVYLQVLDEEVLTFAVKLDGTEVGCERDVMVDRGEYAMGTQTPSTFLEQWNDIPAKFGDWFDDEFSWWLNGDEKGPTENSVRNAADASHSQSDVYSLAGHGYPDSGTGNFQSLELNGDSYVETDDAFGIAPYECPGGFSAEAYYYDGTAWSLTGGCPASAMTDGICTNWGRDVEWVVISACGVLTNDTPASPSMGDWIYNTGVWDDTLFGERPAHGLFGYTDSPSVASLDEAVDTFLSEAADDKTLVEAWKTAVLSLVLYSPNYGIVMHADNAADKLFQPTADTRSTSMSYWYSTGQVAQTAISYTDISAAGSPPTDRAVSVGFTPTPLTTTPPYVMARWRNVSLGPAFNRRTRGRLQVFKPRSRVSCANLDLAAACTFAMQIDHRFSVLIQRQGMVASQYDEASGMTVNATNEGSCWTFGDNDARFPIARNQNGNFVKVMAKGGALDSLVVRYLEPISAMEGQHPKLASVAEAIDNASDVLRASRRVGKGPAVLVHATIEYEDSGRTTPDGMTILQPIWRIEAEVGAQKVSVYVPAVAESRE